jgi:hypothetical protein
VLATGCDLSSLAKIARGEAPHTVDSWRLKQVLVIEDAFHVAAKETAQAEKCSTLAHYFADIKMEKMSIMRANY